MHEAPSPTDHVREPPSTALGRDLRHFREMTTLTTDPAEAELWRALAAEVAAYLGSPVPEPPQGLFDALESDRAPPVRY